MALREAQFAGEMYLPAIASCPEAAIGARPLRRVRSL
jgi:hypothetical protein